MSKLKVKLVKFNKAIAMQVLEQDEIITGDISAPLEFKSQDGIVVMSGARPNLSRHTIQLRGEDKASDNDIVYCKFDSNEEVDEVYKKYMSSLINACNQAKDYYLRSLAFEHKGDINFGDIIFNFDIVRDGFVFTVVSLKGEDGEEGEGNPYFNSGDLAIGVYDSKVQTLTLPYDDDASKAVLYTGSDWKEVRLSLLHRLYNVFVTEGGEPIEIDGVISI